MKHFFSLLFVCVIALGYCQDFSVTFSSGKTLYFNITSKNTVAIAEGKQVVSLDYFGDPVYGYSFSGSLAIPATVTDNGVTYTVTEVDHLSRSNLTSVKIPNTVTKISRYAFSRCKELSTVTLPSALEFIDNGAFYCCTKLSSINFPESLQKIGEREEWGDGAFAGSGLKSIIIPGNVKDVGWNTFRNCIYLTDAEMKEGVSAMGSTTFEGCHRLRTVKLPKSLIPYHTSESVIIKFYDCPSLEKIIVPVGTKAAFEKIIESKHRDKIVEE